MAEETKETCGCPDCETKAAEQKGTKSKASKKSSKEAELNNEIQRLKDELAAQKDVYLRVCAEYDNFRKRSAKEKSEIYNLAACKTVSELLPVLDNLERAVISGTEGADSGYNMIYTQFCELLNKLGVTEMGATGESFDPNLHMAVMHVDDPELEQNIVAEVFQKGYILGDKVVRPACVKVAN